MIAGLPFDDDPRDLASADGPYGKHSTGILPSHVIKRLIRARREVLATEEIGEEQIQPASLDLRLGADRLPHPRELPSGPRPSRHRQARRHGDPRDRLAQRRRPGNRMRVSRAADGAAGALVPYLGSCQSEELDRPARCFHAADHRSRTGVRSRRRKLSRPALCRDQPAHLPHPGAQGIAAEPAQAAPRLAAIHRHAVEAPARGSGSRRWSGRYRGRPRALGRSARRFADAAGGLARAAPRGRDRRRQARRL